MKSKSLLCSFNNRLTMTLIFLLAVMLSVKAQSEVEGILVKLNESLIDYYWENPIEKVYLHTSKDEVLQGDVLYYSIYNTLGLIEAEKNSKVVYVDLISPNNEIVASKTHYIELGRGSGSIDISKGLPTGDYILRAYTNWMRNYDSSYFFQKKIKLIGNSVDENIEDFESNKIDFQFLPEGGNAIVGLNNKIAFRAVDIEGYSRVVEGEVLNSKGDIITPIKTIDNGSGFFYLTPKSGESYYAQLADGTKYPLEKIQEAGYNMQIDNLDQDVIKVLVSATEEFKNNVFYILGTLHQKTLYQGGFQFSDNRAIQIEIPKDQFPSGVMTFTLFNSEKVPMAERAVFVKNSQDLVINTKINKSNFKKRDKIQLDITTTDTNGNPVVADLSLFVNDVDISKKKELSSNIMSYLLLESNIKGYVKEPMRYFIDNSYSTNAKLDLLLLTHGWRRVLWNNDEQMEAEKTYPLEYDSKYDISGRAIGSNEKPLPFITVKMIAESKDNVNFYEAETDNVGRFTIKNIVEVGDVKMSFRGFRKTNENAIAMNVILDEPQTDIARPTTIFPNLESKYLNSKDAILAQPKSKAFESKYSILNGVLLDEVRLSAKKKTNKQQKTRPGAAKSMYGVTPDAVLYPNTDVFMGDVLQNLNQLPGVRITQFLVGGILRKRINIRSSASFNAPGGALIVIDNVVLGGNSDDNVAQIENLNPLDIERFELLTGASTAVFGARGASGVILIYTKRGFNNKSTDSSIHQFLQYDIAKEFYSPNYAVKSVEHQNPDYRTTLYWTPSIITDKDGKASITFFNSDLAKEVQVSVEGYSSNGAIGYHLESYGTNEE